MELFSCSRALLENLGTSDIPPEVGRYMNITISMDFTGGDIAMTRLKAQMAASSCYSSLNQTESAEDRF
jgi:hypothetical protein